MVNFFKPPSYNITISPYHITVISQYNNIRSLSYYKILTSYHYCITRWHYCKHCQHWPVKHGWSSSTQTDMFNQWSWTCTFQPKPMMAIQAGLPNQFLAGGDWLHSNQLDRPQLAGTGFGQTVPVQSLVKHSCSRTAQPALFDQSMPEVKLSSLQACIN